MRTVVRVVVVATVTVLALAGCSKPAYQFVGNDEHDMVLKLPAGWSKVNSDDVLRASGEDPSTAVGWLAFFDSAPQPSVEHASNAYTDDPVMIARSVDVTEDERSTITGDTLRDLVIPVTADGRAQQQLSATTTGDTAPAFKLLRSKNLTTSTERGVHVVFSYTRSGHTEVYDKIAVTDPKLTRIHLVLVHCSQACFSARGQEIERVVSSLTVKP